jgi:hypothetical protein
MTETTCGAENRNGDPCELPAGWGTDHNGEGRCKFHGGRNGRGRDANGFKHGLFSDYLDAEDRNTIDALGEYDDAEKLDELINWRLARLRRAVEALNDDADKRTFWDAFADLVEQTGEPEADQIKELAKMLSHGNRAMQDEIDLVRKLIKDRNKIAEGEDHNLSLRDIVG